MNLSNLRSIVAVGLLAAAEAASSAPIYKLNNTAALNTAASWTGGTVPGLGDTAVWDSTVTGGQTNSLGASLAWGGIQIRNPGGPIQLNSGYYLTNGAAGIDLSQATQDLTLSNTVVINSAQSWQVGAGRTLTLGNGIIKTAGGAVKFYLPDLSAGSALVAVTNLGNTVLTNGVGPYATVNDVDFAAVDGSQHIIGVSTQGSYTSNPSGSTPNITGNLYTLIDFNTGSSGSYGIRASGNAVIAGVRVNQPNPNNISWQLFTYSKVLTLNSILITTNAGNQPVQISGTGVLRIGNAGGGSQDLILFQNNTAAPLVFLATLGTAGLDGTAGIYWQGSGANLVKLGAGTVEIQTPANYAGGTRVYEGTLLLTGPGNVASNTLSVFGGKFSGSVGAVNYAPTTIFAGATNSIAIAAVNGQYRSASNLTFSANSRIEFVYSNGISPSATFAPLVVTNSGTVLSLSNSVFVDVLGALPAGQFPLIKYGALGANGFAALTLANHQPHVSAYLSNNIANSSIDLVVTGSTGPIKWAAGSDVWDLSTANWADSTGASTTYQESGSYGDAVVFEDTLSGASPITVTLNTRVFPSSITVSASKDYTLSGNGGINGAASLVKQGRGVLTLAVTNTFSGGLYINGGVIGFSTLANLGAGGISFGGGTLQYAAGTLDDVSSNKLTFNAGGATFDTGGNNVTFSQPVGNGGIGGLTKIGSGTLTLSGTNLYPGSTIIGAGTLQLNSSAYVSNSSAIYIGSGAVFDAATYAGGLTLGAGQTLAGFGSVLGDVTLPAGTQLSPGTNGAFGSLNLNNSLTVSGGGIDLDISTTSSDALIVNSNLTLASGTLALNVSGVLPNGTYKLIEYSGSLSGAAANLTLTGFSQSGQVASLRDATTNEIDLIVKNQSGLSLTWGGAVNNLWDIGSTANWLNGSAASVYIDGDQVTFDDSASQTSVNLQTAVRPASITIDNQTNDYSFNDGTGTGAGRISGATGLVKKGGGNLIINTLNNNTGPTVINEGTVTVGQGTLADIGTGAITNNGALIFQQYDDRSVAGVVSGLGSLTQTGYGTLTLLQDNSYAGPTTINSGSLQLGNGSPAGSLGAGPVTNNGTLIINRSGAYALTNPIGGSGSLVDAGPARLTLTGANTYQGSTYISNGLVVLTASEQIPDAVTVPNSSGGLILDGGSSAGALDLNGFNESVNSLAGAAGTVVGLVTNSAASGTNLLIVGNDLVSSSTVYYGIIKENSSGAKIRLIKQGAGTLQLSGPNAYSGGTVVTGGTLALGYGGVIGTGSDSITVSSNSTLAVVATGNNHPILGNDLYVADHATLTISSTVEANSFNGNLTGSSLATNNLSGTISAGGGGKQWQSFLGTVVIPSTATLRLSATTIVNGGDNTIFDLEGTLLLRYGGIVSLGALTGAGSIGTPTAGTGTVLVGLKGTDSTFPGTINGSNNVIKSGSGTLTLSGILAHTGSTTVSNGVLVLATDSATLDYSPSVTIRSNAFLDITGHSDGTFNLTNPVQKLSGSGTLRGSLLEDTNGTINPGDTIGTLTVTGDITLGGGLVLELNRTNSPAGNDQLAGRTIKAVAGSTLIVSNLGPSLVNGDTFQLLGAPLAGAFDSITLPATNSNGGAYTWANNLALDGTIQLLTGGVPSVNTNATRLANLVSGSQLTLSWPSDHIGWRLETNSAGLGNPANWHTFTNATSTNLVVFTVDPGKSNVFFRLVYP